MNENLADYLYDIARREIKMGSSEQSTIGDFIETVIQSMEYDDSWSDEEAVENITDSLRYMSEAALATAREIEKGVKKYLAEPTGS